MASDSAPFTHLDASGKARMVDVTAKEVSVRRAVARARLEFPGDTLEALVEKGAPKGSVTGVARVAGIQAAKRTSELIPLCHAIPLHSVTIDFEICDRNLLEVTCAAVAEAKTGVEMEALVGASVAALTVYDMCKAITKGIKITEVALLEKHGGRSGSWTASGLATRDPQ